MTKVACVTGAGGFIGSHLVEHLVAKGYRVRCLHRYTSVASIGWLENVDNSIQTEISHFFGDLRERDSLSRIVSGCDVVFNLAALISIPHSYQAPVGNFETNCCGVLNLLELLRANEFGSLVQMSTSETYGTAQYVPMDERHPTCPQSPYAASKVAADAACQSYQMAFGVDVRIARPFNVFGPRQSVRAVIPRIVQQAIKCNVLELGNIHATRDFTFVERTVDGIEKVFTNGASGRTYNLASGFEVSISQVVELVGKILGLDLEVKLNSEFLRPDASEVNRLFGDSSLANLELGWNVPRDAFEGDLHRFVSWSNTNSELRPSVGLGDYC